MGNKMTTVIEKQFFDTFGIEKRQVDCGQPVRLGCEDCKTCKYSVYGYPEITDSHLLRLIEIIGEKPFGYMYVENCHSTNINNPQDFTIIEGDSFIDCLLTLAMNKKVSIRIKQQVQALFKEG